MSENNLNEVINQPGIEQMDIPEEELPMVICEQYNNIVELDKRIQLAHQKCEQAKSAVDAQVKAKSLNKSEAINSTQDAVRSIADAQSSLADAQKSLLINQQKMADGMRFLLMLGASSISMNRSVIEQLERKLKQAETEELSSNAKDELIGVIRLLKEQESTFQKQERMSEQIVETRKTVSAHTKEIADIHTVDEQQSKKDAEHDKQIADINKVDDNQNKKDAEHDEAIASNTLKNTYQDREIGDLHSRDKEHDESLKKLKIVAYAALAVACAALILAIVAIAL